MRGGASWWPCCDRHQVPLIEDDVYAELYFGRSRAPVHQGGRHRPAWRCTSRRSPSAWRRATGSAGWRPGATPMAIQRQKLSTSLATTVPVQIALADYLRQGGYDKHLRRPAPAPRGPGGRAGGGGRARISPPAPASPGPQGGYFLWLELPPRVDALRLHQAGAGARASASRRGPIFSATAGVRATASASTSVIPTRALRQRLWPPSATLAGGPELSAIYP